MARLAPVMKAVSLAARRDARSAGSVVTNNFFLVTAIFLQRAGAFVFLLLGVILLFPLSADPLRRVPPERLALWPLSAAQRRLLRLVAPWLSWPAWAMAVLIAFAVRRNVSLGLLAMVAAFVAAGFLLSLLPDARKQGIFRPVPAPPGRLRQLVRNHLRQMLATLDFYAALLLAGAAAAYRVFSGSPGTEMAEAMTILTLLALSSHAMCLFGLDGAHGFIRYHLLPVRGWQVVAAKNIAFLAVALVLAAPLSFLPGLAGALAAVAVGNIPSVTEPREQVRWRFSTGAGLGIGLIQTVAIVSAVSTTQRLGPAILLVCAAALTASIWWSGRALDRT